MIAAKRSFTLIRLFFACTVAAVFCLPAASCGTISPTAPGPLSSMRTGFGASDEDKALRELVEKDSFPTARQAGLK